MGTSDALMKKLTARNEASDSLELRVRSYEESLQADSESFENCFMRWRKTTGYAFFQEKNADYVRGRII